MSDPMMVIVDALTAENARLRSEVEIAYKSRDEAVERANRLEWHTVPDLAADLERACANALLHASRNVALETDLARVSGERDRLLEAVDHYFDAYFHGIYDREKADAELLAVRASCSSSTEEQIAACAPPASGEDG